MSSKEFSTLLGTQKKATGPKAGGPEVQSVLKLESELQSPLDLPRSSDCVHPGAVSNTE
jgi:hypothetical protein